MTSEGMIWIKANEKFLGEISDTIWGYAETGLKEYRSSAYLEDIFEKAGFTVRRGVAGMETAFVAEYGCGHPHIGLLAEYDALPGLSQAVSHEQKIYEKVPCAGHGCGHNALAAAVTGGGLAIAQDIQKGQVKGKVTVFGCPAEELLIGKGRMAEAGLFDECDVLLSCHPNDVNYVWARTSNAVWSGKFSFTGRTAHAAIDPYNGRSALDAVELMNVGANYLREHVTPDVRIHYVITNGGEVPNVVPKSAQVWYTIRAQNRESVQTLKARIQNLALGASIMTETTFETETVSDRSDVLRNKVLEQVLLESMKETGAPVWTEEEYRFAERISENVAEGLKRKAHSEYHLDGQVYRGLHTGIYDGFYREGETMAVSTDVGDASWRVPTGVFSFASTVIGSPGHSWLYTSCCGSSIARKGVSMAAQVLLRTAEKLYEDHKRIIMAAEEFKKEQTVREEMF